MNVQVRIHRGFQRAHEPEEFPDAGVEACIRARPRQTPYPGARLTLDGDLDEEVGSVQENGRWYGLLVNLAPSDLDAGDVELTDAERAEFVRHRAAIVSEDGHGSVRVEYFRNSVEARRRWQEIDREVQAATEATTASEPVPRRRRSGSRPG